MDKKILAVIAVIIIIVAGAGAYLVLNQNGESHNNAHAIILDGVEPTEDNVVNNTYEIQRNLVLVTKGEPTGNVANFLNWITCPVGQAILATRTVRRTLHSEVPHPSLTP